MDRRFVIPIAVFAAVGLFFVGTGQQRDRGPAQQAPRNAVAVIRPTEGNAAHGVVKFSQDGREVHVVAEISGLEPGSKHGFHIHQFGDMTGGDGKSMGGHYNPRGTDHALPEKEMRHAGDLGNIEADANGVARLDRTFTGFNLGRRGSVMGRGVVIHALPDDGGQPTGNAGARIGYGVIGFAKTE
ncbi:MAG: superoxide dismutase family protein [Armatimonadetes bacterium]|nr:superoxide dismutase family protein [Armatimonadota bacterium]